MQDLQHLGTAGEPACHFEARAIMLREPHRERAGAAQRQEDVVGPGADAKQADALGEQRPRLRVRRDRAEHDVGMAADIFGGGLHADVDTLVERAVKQGRRPGVVVDDERAPRMCDFGDGGDVAHFKRLRAGRFHQHCLGVGLEQAFDCSADQWIEIADLDAVAGEHAVAEVSRGAVDVVGHQHMIAGAQHRKQGGGDRR